MLIHTDVAHRMVEIINEIGALKHDTAVALIQSEFG
jgi:hypothetical protein